jgi:hypothetical protein
MKLDIKLDFLKKKKNFKKKDNPAIDPNLYWRIMLFLGLFIILVSLGLGYYLVKEVNKEPDLPILNGSTNNKITKKERIEAMLEYFRQKEEKSIETINTNNLIIDPSL